IASEQARLDALYMGLSRKDGAGALLEASEEVPGVLGSVSALLTVEAGYEASVAAALGSVADAVALAAGQDARDALNYLKSQEAGRAGLLLGRSDVDTPEPEPSALPVEGAVWARSVVTPPDGLRAAVDRALAGTVVVDDIDTAAQVVRDLADTVPGVVAVTGDGEVLGRHWAFGGSARSESVLEVQAAVDEARDRLRQAQAGLERASAELEGARAEQQARRDDVAAVKEQRSEAKVRRARATERLERTQQAARSAEAEVQRLRENRGEVERGRDEELTQLRELEQRLAAISEEPVDEDPDTTERDQAAEDLAQARQAETDARLALRTAEARAPGVVGKADRVRREAAAEQQARERPDETRRARAEGAEIAGAVVSGGEVALERIEQSLERAVAERDAAQQRKQEHEHALGQVRQQVRELSGELEKLTDALHRDEVARAEQRMRIEQLESKIGEEFAIGLDELVAEYGPDVAVPPSADEMAEYEQAKERGESVAEPQPIPYERETQERRAKRAEKDLKQ